MTGRVRRAAFALVAALAALALAGCSLPFALPFAAPDSDVVRVEIRLDLGEDIGLLLTDWTANGHSGMSGASNADRSLIARDSTEYWELDRQCLGRPADAAELSLRFIIVTEYFEPSYDFDYPESCTVTMDPVAFTAEFGKTYAVSITGSRADGYRAALVAP